ACGQRLGDRARDPLIQIRFESRILEASTCVERLLISQNPKGSLENAQRYLTGQPFVGEATSWPPRLIAIRVRGAKDSQVVLRVLELSQETVLEDVDLLDVLAMPHVRGFIAHVAYFERCGVGELALNAEAPVLHVGRHQIRIDVV